MFDISFFYIFTAAFAISQIVLLLAKILGRKNIGLAKIFFSAFLICVAVYLSKPLILTETQVDSAWHHYLWRHLPTAIPALFLLCCVSIFEDDFEFNALYLSPLLLTLLPPFVFDIFSLQTELLSLLLVSLPQYLEFLLLLAGLGIVLFSWRSDLIEKRRRFRFFFMAFAGTIILVVISAQQFSNFTPAQINLLHFPFACLFLLSLNLFLLDLNERVLLFNDTKAASTNNARPLAEQGKPSVQDPALQKLKKLMEEDCLYRSDNLTLTKLADILALPEYKTRALINQQLGFRNFNAFLNHYRIQEAAERLASSKQSITQIANDLGYNALSVFNRAFRQIHQMTPSEFRKISKATASAT